MKIGKYSAEEIETGTFALDGGAMFGIIPRPLWEKSNPADEVNRVKLSARCLLLRGGNRNILIDTGMGDKWDDKSEKIYHIDYTHRLTDSLAEKGLRPEDITDVILTHLHFDHTGGSTYRENGKLMPSFPNARHFAQRKNYKWAISPSDRDRGSYIKDNFVPLFEHGLLNLPDGEWQFDDEITLIPVNGHTFSQQLVKISGTEGTLLYCGDLVPFASHIHLPYIMGYDLQPLVTLEEKKNFLAQAADGQWHLFFEHDPYSVAATVERTEKGFALKERFNSL